MVGIGTEPESDGSASDPVADIGIFVSSVTMMRWIEGIVSSLRCEGGGHVTPHMTFSGDTDMVTAGLASLTSVVADEIVIAEMLVGEFEEGGGVAFQTRINNLLARDDL